MQICKDLNAQEKYSGTEGAEAWRTQEGSKQPLCGTRNMRDNDRSGNKRLAHAAGRGV